MNLKENTEYNRSILESTLFSYSTFENGWDGYSGVPARISAVYDSIKFISLLSINHKLPVISLAGDGEICFYWEANHNYLELGFFGDTYYSYFFRDSKSKKDICSNDISINIEGLTKEVMSLLSLF